MGMADVVGAMQEFDFMVIGSGSGLDVANAMAGRGNSVAVVEEGRLGGTCLNRGCIPSKQLLYHADVMETIEGADAFEIDAEVRDVDFAEIVRKVNDDVSGSSESIRKGLMSSDAHDLFSGTGRFVDDRTVEIVDGDDEGATLRADTILVATGTRPSIPSIDGIEDVEYLTSTEALRLESPPDRLVIVGGGYIAAELGHFFGTFGSDVTIVGRREHLLPEADAEVGEAFTDRYADRFDVYAGYEAVAVDEVHGEVTVEARPYPEADAVRAGGETVGAPEEAEDVTVSGDALLVAAGRQPNTDALNLDATGVKTDDAGFVETDEYLRTDAEGVWALGDVVGEYLLKHSANHEAKAVVRNLLGDEPEPVDYSAMPFAVFASPEVAGVGARERDLREADAEYATGTYAYDDTARGSAMHAEGFVKVLIDLDGNIEGCHIIGPEASNLIEEVVVAMTAGSGTVEDVRDTVHIHPALSEVVDRAFSGQFSRSGGHDHGHQH